MGLLLIGWLVGGVVGGWVAGWWVVSGWRFVRVGLFEGVPGGRSDCR